MVHSLPFHAIINWLLLIFCPQKSLKKEHFLWQLSTIHKDIAKINDDLEAERRNREGVMQELEKFEHEASKKKKEQAKYLKEITQCEKKISERNSKLGKNVSCFRHLVVLLAPLISSYKENSGKLLQVVLQHPT